MYVNAEAVRRLLTDIQAVWDREGFGSNERVSEPLYARLTEAITQLSRDERKAE